MTVEWSADASGDLEAPVMIVAFDGWNDAADVCTSAVEFVELAWDAEPLAEIGGDDFYCYGDQRPRIVHRGGVSRHLHWPCILLSSCRPVGLAQDVVVVKGEEPALRWRAFAREFVDLVDTLGVSQVVLLGAYLSDEPHTRPIRLTGTAFSRGRLTSMEVEASEYEGPTGITGVLQQVLTEAGVPTVSVWAAVPHYVASPPNPKGTLAMLEWLRGHIGIPLELGTLGADAQLWESRVDEAAAEDEDLAEYVRSLEEDADERAGREDPDPEPDRGIVAGPGEMPLVDGDSLAAEFERYLRGGDGGAD